MKVLASHSRLIMTLALGEPLLLLLANCMGM